VNPRRALTAAVLGGAVAGGLTLFAAGQRWAGVTAERPPPLPPVVGSLTGSAAAPLVPAMGLLVLAAAVALVAVSGVARVVLGAALAVGGGVLVWSAVRALTGGLAEAATQLPGVGRTAGPVTVDAAAGWPVAVIAAGLLAVVVGLLVVLRGRGWPGMGRRYERPGAPSAARERSEEERSTDAWRALDRGVDPTVDPAVDPAVDPTDAPGSGTH
jgi:uncharacterized membrane protein (TIGR02234 family)